MINELKKNVDTEISILREIYIYSQRVVGKKGMEKRLIDGTINSLTRSLKILNNSIPEILREISVVQQLPKTEKKKNLEQVKMKRTENDIEVIIPKRDRERFLEELSISENFIKRIKKKGESGEKFEEFKAARGYLKYANKFFLNSATNYINKGHFHKLYLELKKSNIGILFETYIAMIFFTTFLSFFVGIFLIIFLTFFELSFIFPFFSEYDGNILIRILKISWLIIFVPIITFFVLYFYPSLEKRAIEKNIDRELPFAVIHMSAISGSGLNPIDIFRIIGLSKEYPYLRKEVRKILNQINLYGYDLITALNNSARDSPSEKLSDLYSGLSTTMYSGGNLKEFFEKRSETLLLSYRLEREKYSRMAETFMDIYISVVIAAPMVLMLLLIIISISNFGLTLGQFQITAIIISVISLINVLFLVFLHLKQPSY